MLVKSHGDKGRLKTKVLELVSRFQEKKAKKTVKTSVTE